MNTDQLLTQLAAIDEDAPTVRAPARLKSTIYSALVNRMAEAGSLRTLRETKRHGAALCIFEEVVATLPLDQQIGSKNPCRICHARVLAERLDWAPIFWPGCPYSEFHND